MSRDPKTFLIKIKEKYPQYNQYDDATLLSKIQEKYPQYSDIKLGGVENTNNFLKRAIDSNRIGSLPLTGLGMIPSTGSEALDAGKVAIRNTINPLGDTGPIGFGANLVDQKGTNLINDPSLKSNIEEGLTPETPYGKSLDSGMKIAPWAMLGLEGASAGAKGIGKFLSKGNLPEEINTTKSSIQDIIKMGPGKVKSRVGDIFNEFQSEFGKRLESINSKMTSDSFSKVLESTANDLGGSDIPGSIGNRVSMMAKEIKGTPRSFDPKEIQIQAKTIMDSLGANTMAKAKFYNNFTNVLSDEVPELASLKSQYAPVFDIAKQSKKINSGALRDVASDKIGPEQLGEVTQAQQMMGDNPNIVEQAYAGGAKLRSQQNELQKIIGRQKTAKIAGAGALGYAGYRGGKGILDLIFGSGNQNNQGYRE